MSAVTSPTVVKTRLNALGFEPIILPGQKIRIQQKNSYAYYELPRFATPFLIPPVDINLAVPNTTTLAVLADTGQQTGRTVRIEDWNTEAGVLAQYRFLVRDPGVFVTVSQPAGAGRFVNANGVTRFHYGNTMAFFKQQLWSMIPEFFIWEDQTPPTITAINADPNRVKHFARVTAFGFGYPLEFIRTRTNRAGQIVEIKHDAQGNEIEVPIMAATTVSVGANT
jgi:hypothetical protein